MKLLAMLSTTLALAVSCTSAVPSSTPRRPEATPASEPPASAVEAASPEARAPLIAELKGPAMVNRGDVVELSLVVHRFSPAFNPIAVQVVLPKGATLVSGQMVEVIDDKATSSWTRTLKVKVDEVPAGDVVLIADVKGDGFGAHATSAYRFGRPEPLLAEPPRGEPRSVGGIDVGGAVPLTPTVGDKLDDALRGAKSR